ncbi:hypothetical protein N7492_007717 [Penicillium capsulatum]|uniref:NACHT domain-containing protein n=1 Tax=Penicillium capsulatum TaxID=69766 RepID=A0A9W9I5M7_9EURO|nr:hypothetical protein N7492_007717 [Penicillium capsulatum]KAJ6117549.1 hypothetical protein N7512_007274 [Penicillium capsulatum]
MDHNNDLGQVHCPFRPTDVHDLIHRIKHPERDKHEFSALIALVQEMIEIFRHDQRATYLSEAALLAEATEGQQYDRLMSIFYNAIIEHTSANNVLDLSLLQTFALTIHYKGTISAENHHLGATLNSLNERIDMASKGAEMQKQYQLVCMLGVVLETMVDIKVTGLHRESLHGPLLAQLRELSGSLELRLAQAASYAYEALRAVPDDEGPYEALGRYAGNTISVLANMAGAVSKMDPSSLVETAPTVMKLLGAINTMAENGKQLYQDSEDLKSMFVAAVNDRAKPRKWFDALRYSRLLLEAEAFNILKQILPVLPRDREWFWFGLYSQLEQSWLVASRISRTQAQKIEEFVDWMHAQEFFKTDSSECDKIPQWRSLVMETMRRPEPDTTPSTEDRRHSWKIWRRKKKKKKDVKPKLKVFLYQSNDLRGIPTQLFSTAWEQCHDAHKYYADAGLLRYYTQGNQLQIRRISGDPLDLEDCYINLSTVEGSAESGKDGTGLEASLGSRLKVETPEPGKEVNLSDLFKERPRRKGCRERPRRILIRGRAGVGKTTLSKKIVYDFCHGKMWHGEYHRIIWIPLHKLKVCSDLESFMMGEFFAASADKKLLADALCTLVLGGINHTVFLLDGFDEVVGAQSDGVKLVEKFQHLFLRENTIITSRPEAAISNVTDYDLELETIGFRPDQVQVYVNRMVKDETHRAEIREFVRTHPTIAEVLRIPIQLDALCFTWGEGLIPGVKTMSALYQAIEIKLWRKDKTRENPITDNKTKKYRLRSQIETEMGEEMKLLELLAFNGVYHNVVELRNQHRDVLYDAFPHWSDSTLDGLSFLRTPDSDIYYFIHLTFQEYFAARYFIRCWIGDEPLLIFPLDQMTREDISPRSFLAKEKYNGRYDMIWRFVSGLLPAPKLIDFLGVIESEPRDLLGPTHLRLQLHCFNEVPLSPGDPELRHLHSRLEELCGRLISDPQEYYRLTHRPSVAEEPEFPEHILEQSLNDQPGRCQRTLAMVSRRPGLSSTMLQTVMNIVKDDREYRRLICATMARNSASVQDDILRVLRDPSSERHDELIRSLSRFNAFSEKMILVLLSHNQNHSKEFWAGIWKGCRRIFSKEALHRILEDERVQVRGSFCLALKHHMPLPDGSWDLVQTLLKDPSSYVRQGIANGLEYQSDLPQHIVKDLALILTSDESRETRKNAVLAFLAQKSLSPGLLSLVEDCMTNDGLYEKKIIDAFCRHSDLTAEMRTSLESMLQDPDLAVVQNAAETLSKHSDYIVDLLDSLCSAPEMGTLQIPHHAVICFQRCTKLPERILQGLLVLSRQDDELATHARKCITNQESLPESISRAVIAMLQSEDPKTSSQGAQILRWLPNLPNGLSDALILLLRDPQTPSSTKDNAISVFNSGSAWQEHVLSKFIQ